MAVAAQAAQPVRRVPVEFPVAAVAAVEVLLTDSQPERVVLAPLASF